MNFMNVADIARLIVNMDNRSLTSINLLIKSCQNDEFFSALNAALNVCKDENSKNLVTQISNYYMSTKTKESKTFFNQLKLITSCFFDRVPEKVNDLLLLVRFFEDEKLQYDLLKSLSRIVKDKETKHQVWFDILKTKYATVSDYNIVISAWARGMFEMPVPKLQALINNWLAAFVAYVSVKQPVNTFDFVMKQVNKTLNEVAVKSPGLADDIAVSYDIKPKNVYIQDEYINRFAGTNLIESANLRKNFSIVNEKNNSLKKSNSYLRNELTESEKLTAALQKKLEEKNCEIKALRKQITRLETTINNLRNSK